MDLLDLLLEHDRWATVQLLELSRGLDEAQFDREFDVGRRTLRTTFRHMSGSLAFWTGVMTGQPIDEPRDYDRSVNSLLAYHERTYAAFAAFARRLRDEQRLADTFPDFEDENVRLSFGSAITHVILHHAQHRAEALHLLERLGVPNLPEANPLDWELQTQGR